MPTLKSYLEQIRTLLSDPNNWCQRASARDSAGRRVFFQRLHGGHQNAKSYCVSGAALQVTLNYPDYHDITNALDYQAKRLFPFPQTSTPTFIRVNDELGHAAVLQMLDAAIAATEEQEQC